MINCTPKSPFSWEFELEGDGHRGTVKVKWFREQGTITADGETFEVKKQGMASGQWTLEHHGQAVASALKEGAFRRTFEVKGQFGTFVLRPERFFGRRFVIETANQPVAKIRPVQFFTRRATIEVERENTPFAAVAFMFWLVLVTWRRTRRRD
jgi:hypothetical protein